MWRIPSDGLTAHLKESAYAWKDTKRIQFTEFHPTSNNILATASATNVNEVKVWDISTGDEVFSYDDSMHEGLIVDMEWNWDGSLLERSAKDKYVRLWDPRSDSVASKFIAHNSLRPTKFTWLDDGKILTTGFKGGKRETRVWDIRKIQQATRWYANRYGKCSALSTVQSWYEPYFHACKRCYVYQSL